MITKEKLPRKFILSRNNKEIELADPNENFSPDEVMAFYSNNYPELATSTIEGPKYSDDGLEYRFKTTVGTKG